MTTIEYRISDTLYTKVLEFGQWILRPGYYSDIGFWFDSVGWVDISEGPIFPAAMPNVVFPPDSSPELVEEIYLDVRHFRNDNLNVSWGTEKTLVGILQISVVNPKQDGELNAVGIAGMIAEYFVKNSNFWTDQMERILIYEHPTVLTAVQDGHRSIFPVSIPYRCFKA